jgi:hypothetical protein
MYFEAINHAQAMSDLAAKATQKLCHALAQKRTRNCVRPHGRARFSILHGRLTAYEDKA